MNKYTSNFEELTELGRGSFGLVHKTKCKLDNKFYAIKIVYLDVDDSERKKSGIDNEVKNLKKLNSNYIIRYYDSWYDGNHSTCYIQMQLGLYSLHDVIDRRKAIIIANTSSGQSSSASASASLSLVMNYISVRAFKEIVIGVNYLHTRRPPILHRDLKPKNILIVDDYPNSGRRLVLKLCDFDLATDHKSSLSGHTSQVGTDDYRAPEVIGIDKGGLGVRIGGGGVDRIIYNTKADIYSLGLVGSNLFDVNIFGNETIDKSDPIYNIVNQLIAMIERVKDKRPSCQQILSDESKWLINGQLVRDIKNIDNIVSMLLDDNDQQQGPGSFFHQYLLDQL
ncbi:uncharacterized protein LOC128956301 [Oppia nitens]|uniref:uncharacterized protein LOC128956301 n=1 Tax=Oppia nitens TaxID=1686743 RepID=UPI0023DAED5F|nr:uncharacterized protein LOC128956301 [Oppia nitens]